MSDYVKRMTADNYCDFCRTNLEGYNHEDWCPIVEIEKLREAIRMMVRLDKCASPDVYKIAREALGDD